MLRVLGRNLHLAFLQRSASNSYVISRTFCEKVEKNNAEENLADQEAKLSGFAKAFEKFSHSLQHEEKKTQPDVPFPTLFKNSKFVELGDPEGKVVVGKIFHIVNDDLYIDFGWKFHCVCTRPAKNGNAYVRGARVKLRIKELELSSRFLGSAKDLTLLEADCHILGILSSPAIPKAKVSVTAPE